MEELLTDLFDECADFFLEDEVENIMDDVAERNLCGRLAIHITPKLAEYNILGYYADPEYNRKQGGQVKTILDDEMNVITIQCDLIIHSRGRSVEQDNLIAIEMKKSTRPESEKVDDRKRLRAMTKDRNDDIYSYDGTTHPEHVCGYLLGVYIILNIAQRTCVFEYYQHGNKVNERTQRF